MRDWLGEIDSLLGDVDRKAAGVRLSTMRYAPSD